MSMSWEEQCGRLIEAHGQAFLTACTENVRAFQELSRYQGNDEAARQVRALGHEQVRFWQKLGMKVQRLAEWEGEGDPRCLVGGEYLISCDCAEPLVWKVADQHYDGDHSDCNVEACEEAAAMARAHAASAMVIAGDAP